MTGDTHREDEDLEFDHDFGMEDQADGLDDLFDDVEPSPRARREETDAESGEDDALFQPTDAGNPLFGEDKPEFDEEQDSEWPGQDMEPDEIGMPIEDSTAEEETTAFAEHDPLASESEDFALDANEELQLIHDDSELEAEEDGPDMDDAFVLDDEGLWGEEAQTTGDSAAWDAEEQEHEDWAPPAEEAYEEPAMAQEPAVEQDPAAATYWQDQAEMSYSELEDYYDESSYEGDVEEQAPAIQGPRRSSRVLRLVAGLAAALLVLSAGAVVVLEPELLGLKVEPELIHRVQIARPTVELRVDPPQLPVSATDPVSTDPVTTDPVTTDPVTTDPVTTDPVTTDPVTTDPVTTDPVTTDPATTDPVTDPVTKDPVTTDPMALADPNGGPTIVAIADPSTDPVEGLPPTHVQVGEGLSIGAFEQGAPSRILPEIGIIPGSNAFAQLKNGNFFVGSVKSVAEEDVTLRIENGEVTFIMDDLVKIAPLVSAEYAELARAQRGFVRLTNKNRLAGSILEHVADDHIILEMKSNRVLLPRSAIEEINSVDRPRVHFSSEESDEEWVRRLVEEQMNDPSNFDNEKEDEKNRVKMRLQEKR